MVSKIGEENVNNSGELMKVISYRNARDISVMFEDGNIIDGVYYGNFKTGNVKNYFKPTIFERGFYGDVKTRKRDYIYSIWFRMMERCYSENQTIKDKQPRYNGICTVNEEWWNYQNFKKWYYDNLFVKSDKARGNLPIGVSKGCGNSKKFRAYCNHTISGKKKQKSLGCFPTPEDAFYAYKSFKESYIKQVADEYKSKYPNFPQKLYDAMYSYEVEITD